MPTIELEAITMIEVSDDTLEAAVRTVGGMNSQLTDSCVCAAPA